MSTTAADNPATNNNNNNNTINGNGSGIQYKIHSAYLNPLLAKHRSNQSLVYEDLIRSYEAAKRVVLLLGKHNGTTTGDGGGGANQNEYAEKLLNELHNSQLRAYDKAARTALAQHASSFDLPPIQSGETERVYVKKCVDASLCDVNCRGWRMVMDDNDDTAALVEELVGKKIRDRAAKLYREQRAEKFAIGVGAAVGVGGVGHRREASAESTSVARGNNSKTLSTIAEEGNGDETPLGKEKVAQPEGDERVDVAAVTADAPIEDDGEDGGDEDDEDEEEGENAEDEEDMSEGEINEDDEENDNPEDDDADEAEEENDGDGDEEEDADDGSDQVPEAPGKTGGAVMTRQGRRGAAALKPTTKRVAAQAGVSPPGQQPKRTRTRPTGMGGGAARTGRQSPGAGRAGRGGRRSAKRSRRGGRGGGGKL